MLQVERRISYELDLLSSNRSMPVSEESPILVNQDCRSTHETKGVAKKADNVPISSIILISIFASLRGRNAVVLESPRGDCARRGLQGEKWVGLRSFVHVLRGPLGEAARPSVIKQGTRGPAPS